MTIKKLSRQCDCRERQEDSKTLFQKIFEAEPDEHLDVRNIVQSETTLIIAVNTGKKQSNLALEILDK